MYSIVINRCGCNRARESVFLSKGGCDIRIAGQSCCGIWEEINRWKLSIADLLHLSEESREAYFQVTKDEF